MALIAALASSIIFGMADFFGGYAARSVPVRVVVWISQIAGLATVGVAAMLLRAEEVATGDLVWGALAGLSGMIGLLFFYDGLARGRMSVVSPVAGLTSIGAPVGFGLIIGERPSTVAVIGVLLALPAVLLITVVPEQPEQPTELWRAGALHGLVAGSGFAGFFILISRTAPESGMWPLASARTTTVIVLGLLLLVRSESQLPGGRMLSVIIAAGIADIVANALFLLASRGTLLILAAVIVSLYPVSTLLLAKWVLHERTTRQQRLGLALGAAAVVVIGVA